MFRNFYQMNLLGGYGYTGGMATKVLWAMIVVYFAKAVLIIAREAKAWIISAIQAFFCFYVYEDFTFLPVTTLIRNVIFHFAPDMDYGWIRFLAMVTISALFSLEILKTYLLFALTEELPSRTAKKRRAPRKKEPVIAQPEA